MYPLFGGYHAYMVAPYDKVLKHRLRIMAKWSVEREMNAETDRSYKH